MRGSSKSSRRTFAKPERTDFMSALGMLMVKIAGRLDPVLSASAVIDTRITSLIMSKRGRYTVELQSAHARCLTTFQSVRKN